MKNILLTLGFLFAINAYGQHTEKDVYDLPIPRNLEQCFKILGKTLSENELFVIRTFPEDSIYFNNEFKNGADFFHAWKIYDGSRLTKFFNKKGLSGSHEIYETILISYHRYFNSASYRFKWPKRIIPSKTESRL